MGGNDASAGARFAKQPAIAQESARQILALWQRYGILLKDRHDLNIMIDRQNQVWQIDLDLLYDGFTDKFNVIDAKENLLARVGKVRLADPGKAVLQEGKGCRMLVENLLLSAQYIKNDCFSEKEAAALQAIYDFRDKLIVMRKSDYQLVTGNYSATLVDLIRLLSAIRQV